MIVQQLALLRRGPACTDMPVNEDVIRLQWLCAEEMIAIGNVPKDDLCEESLSARRAAVRLRDARRDGLPELFAQAASRRRHDIGWHKDLLK
ncbi:hypothetical protein [Paraburkholderia sp. LEh10]|jgi:hypothetical protein|uniref:hypothetical protein n=1 Tax=Paraburkholderia sp. LEh10 TaxID=2821353 RepID=UPI001FD78F85|nr:hypothetical protein [Paraburkholderia sp. LEh10]